jgi:hypothetical protein
MEPHGHVPFVYPEELRSTDTDTDVDTDTDTDLNQLYSMLLKSSNPAAAALVTQVHQWATEATRLLRA